MLLLETPIDEEGRVALKEILCIVFTLLTCNNFIHPPRRVETQLSLQQKYCFLPDAPNYHPTSNKSPSLHFKKPHLLRTRRSDQDLFSSSQFFSAENFSSLAEWDEPVREISDQELTKLGFPIPTPSPEPESTTRSDFRFENSDVFIIISRKYG